LSVLRGGVSLASFLMCVLVSRLFVSLKIEKQFKMRDEKSERGWCNRCFEGLATRGQCRDCFERVMVVFAIVWILFMSRPLSSGYSADLAAGYALTSISAIAIGIQSVAISSLGTWGIITTCITGTYTSFLVGVIRSLSGGSPSSRMAKQ
jgi:hypothetical protein